MLNLRRTALTVAVLAGLGLATTASAVSITHTGTLPEGVANFDIAGNSIAIGITPQIAVSIDPSDNIIGRTTGFALRITLSGSATFATTPTFTAGPSLPSGWTVTLGAGGTGSNFAVVSFNPPSSNPVPAITNGVVLYLNPGNTELNASSGHALNNLAALQTLGQTVSENYQFFDPVSATPILNPVSQPVLVSGQPFVPYCIVPFFSPSSERIDVGTNTQHPSRTYFSTTGAIGALNANSFNPGAFEYLSGPYWNPAFSYFTVQPTDQIVTTIQGPFGAFNQAGAFAGFMAYGPFVAIPAVISSNGLTISYTPGQVPNASYGFAGLPLFSVPTNNLIPIDATPVVQQTTYTRNGITDTLPPGCNLLSLQYNGPVVRVYTFNPAGNTTQQSFLRISDTGPASGPVFITGVDDAGNPGTGQISFTLGAGQSIQLTADDLQNGNTAKGLTGALGIPTGKWRLTVTSYFPNLVVTSLNRNNISGTVSNLTNYDVNGKQNTWGNNGDNGN